MASVGGDMFLCNMPMQFLSSTQLLPLLTEPSDNFLQQFKISMVLCNKMGQKSQNGNQLKSSAFFIAQCPFSQNERQSAWAKQTPACFFWSTVKLLEKENAVKPQSARSGISCDRVPCSRTQTSWHPEQNAQSIGARYSKWPYDPVNAQEEEPLPWLLTRHWKTSSWLSSSCATS